ncbi:hypothetical protein L1887_53621 [Cichorium endivia]|nr:hypothetical protein L1887_53621 [Cichorium endivia]
MLSKRFVEAMAKRYGQYDAVVGWQIDNELGCHGTVRTYDNNTRTRYQQWLADKYNNNITLYNEMEGRLARETGIDLATWDSYPLGNTEQFAWISDSDKVKYGRTGTPDFQALHHDLYRGVAGAAYNKTAGPFGIMEQQPGPVNWAPYNPLSEARNGADARCRLLRRDNVPDHAYLEQQQTKTEGQADVALVFDYAAQWLMEAEASVRHLERRHGGLRESVDAVLPAGAQLVLGAAQARPERRRCRPFDAARGLQDGGGAQHAHPQQGIRRDNGRTTRAYRCSAPRSASQGGRAFDSGWTSSEQRTRARCASDEGDARRDDQGGLWRHDLLRRPSSTTCPAGSSGSSASATARTPRCRSTRRQRTTATAMVHPPRAATRMATSRRTMSRHTHPSSSSCRTSATLLAAPASRHCSVRRLREARRTWARICASGGTATPSGPSTTAPTRSSCPPHPRAPRCSSAERTARSAPPAWLSGASSRATSSLLSCAQFQSMAELAMKDWV